VPIDSSLQLKDDHRQAQHGGAALVRFSRTKAGNLFEQQIGTHSVVAAFSPARRQEMLYLRQQTQKVQSGPRSLPH
jgi:hypothetical protein